MYSHEPDDYKCPFCTIVDGRDDVGVWTKQEEVVLRGDVATAWVAPKWWPENAGHVLVVPNDHIENMYEMPQEVAGEIHEMARQVALALKVVYGCDGVSTRQHNEPDGNQEVWHYHLHVFPRYNGYDLYARHYEMWFPEVAERIAYAEKLRAYFENGKTS